MQAVIVPSIEPEPDLSDAAILGSVAGLRPYREGGFRIEFQLIDSKPVVHNYGHGGAGVTMSWGSAVEVVSLIKKHAPQAESVRVIGGGVIGLTSALLLREAGFRVRVSSELYTPKTTSDIAGAQWSPALVEVSPDAESQAMFRRILQYSFYRFSELQADSSYGISIRPNYVEADHDTYFYNIPEGILPTVQMLHKLPFSSNPVGGRVFTTYLIEPPIFMPRLMEECRSRGIEFQTQRINSTKDFAHMSEDVVVNCTGCGAGPLMNDNKLVPVRGQLVLLRPQHLPWMLSHRDGYIFPRQDGVVLGGTVERAESESTTTPVGIAQILAGNRGFFRKR